MSAPARTRVAGPWLALLAGPLSFGIAGPALILPDAAASLGTGTAAVTWIVTAFGWGIAVGTPLLAGLHSHRGVRTALLTCAALVLAGAVVAATVAWLPALVVGSALQGLGTAGFTTVAMSLAGSARAMGLVTSSLAVVGSASPLIGDLVGDALGWQLALALPAVSLLAVPAVLRSAPRTPVVPSRFDPMGAILVTALVTALVFVPHFWLPAGVAVVLIAVLVAAHLRSRPDGFVPAVLLRTPVFLISAGLAFVLAVVNFGLMYVLPPRLTEHSGWTSGEVGLALLWPLLFGGLVSYVVVAATARTPFRVVAVLFPALAAIGLVLTGVSVVPVVLLVAQALASLAAASGQGVYAVRAGNAVDSHRAPAMGLFNLTYLLGAAFGPAIAALLA
ncbi:MFS transporter [Actinosynnema sp. NPDC047251]|uniref:Permease, MFS-type n=1 Tax=Saccharothrix espanaensis (strain ATCC 51144 / DSM 44229 / JCM 9112 / NBRC 15066 / NRRL 15764) TaxID=1179773 RepID=K0K6M8_SACES|nr:MFS transporter [Saccharothrix espanaensis]CCH32223.1 Permease, MFS-type [Saccharothrix espanaensis DSM 44229]